MPTPTTAFADVAAEFGSVDPDDLEAVQQWFLKKLSELPPETIERVLHELLEQDGKPATRKLIPRYPLKAPVPSLSSSPPVLRPLLSEGPRGLLRRLFSRTRRH